MNGDIERQLSRSLDQTDHDLLVRIDEKILFLGKQIVDDKATLLNLISDLTKRMSETETRVGGLVAFNANLMGKISVAVAVWAFIVSVVVALVLKFVFKT